MTDDALSNTIAELDLYIVTHGNPLTPTNQFEEACNEVKWWDPGDRYRVVFTAGEIRIPTEDCQISYSKLCEPRFYTATTQQNKDGKCIRRNILRLKAANGGLVYLYTSAQDELDKGWFSSELTKATPSPFPAGLQEYLQAELSETAIEDAPNHILTEFVRDSGGEYWVSGISEDSADIDISGTANTSSTGVEIGAITRSKATSEISLSGKSNTNRRREFISVFIVYSDRIFIDGYYGGFSIEAHKIHHIGDSGVINIVIPYCTLKISSTDGMELTVLDLAPVDCAML